MKQKSVNNLIGALSDEPKAIGVRLEELGFDPQEVSKKFSEDLLAMPVYGSSFIKFLQDNRSAFENDPFIPADPLPADFKNPFDDKSMSIGDRLAELGLEKRDTLFSKDILNLEVTGDEFQGFITKNQAKFIGEIGRLAELGGTDG
ncbi:hypothetical protein A2870_04170 [Candidatus Curtissbacteria bacterium RIFCSPHIGHO2_01_FULL_41_11]|uniref:Uncharacterized protein n=1 Tax=Candidatus Curtissbacteria bacterium RIFCSPHIGHO2_01_FULL_41_11 TaxID=1797711 RepID=A0A1F5G6N8_9BACT|nr:MAG: hypothetical protein A2870_04170 [Candidatus Curtissbacteria bacterium RIFCSPHIGHO2_01_FULL_41_11]